MSLRKEDVAARALGRWRGILRHYGIDERALSGRHTACPICGGKDRFRFDDQEGRGTYFCNGCGAGDGFTLLTKHTGAHFADVLRMVSDVCGGVPAVPAKQEQGIEAIRRTIQRIVRGAQPVAAGDPVARYLAGRGIHLLPRVRCHPGLGYYDETGAKVGTYPAMVAAVVSPKGEGMALHRTYLQDGRKAPVPSAKKLTKALGDLSGCAIRLFPPRAGVIGIAEGIETACAATVLYGVPTWSAVSAVMLETFVPPEGIEAVHVFGDADESYAGQAAAYRLAARLRREGYATQVYLPPALGVDFADLLPRLREAA